MTELEVTGEISNHIVGMDGLCRRYSGTRHRNLIHGFVNYRSIVGQRPDHWVELRWIPNQHIVRYLRTLPRSTTRLLVDILETEVSHPFMAAIPERELPLKELVAAPGHRDYQRRQQTPATLALHPTGHEARFIYLLESAYLHFVADEVQLAMNSLSLNERNDRRIQEES